MRPKKSKNVIFRLHVPSFWKGLIFSGYVCFRVDERVMVKVISPYPKVFSPRSYSGEKNIVKMLLMGRNLALLVDGD